MKKNYVFLLLVFMSLGIKAQCPLTTAVDFTATDINGQTHNLFSYLNAGKYVLIDFFYTTCGPCQQTAPKVQGAYEHFGCNSSNVIFLSIDQGDNNSQVTQFDNTYGIHCPSISGVEGGGTAINSTYGITAFPTVILIAPNKNIIEQDIWPISDAAFLISKITTHGGIPAACVNGVNDLKNNKIISVYPNPANDYIKIDCSSEDLKSLNVQIYNVLGELVFESKSNDLIQVKNLNNGSYFVKVFKNEVLFLNEKLLIIR